MDILSVLTFLITLFLVLFVSLFLHSKWRQSVLRRHGIDGPKPDIFFGNFNQYRKKGLLNTFDEWLARYGKVFGYYIGNEAVIMVKDLDMIKEVTIKRSQDFQDRMLISQGRGKMSHGIVFQSRDTWKRQRTIMAPTFSSQKLRQMEETIAKCGTALAETFGQLAEDGEIVRVRKYFGRFSLDIIIKIAFGIESDDPGEMFAKCEGLKPSRFGAKLSFLAFIFPKIGYVIDALGINLLETESYYFILDVLQTMLKLRKNNNDKPAEMKDFLQLLLNAEGIEYSPNGQETIKKLSPDEVLGQMYMFLIAGHETTASTLGYLTYCLATNQHVQDKVHEEINTLLGDEAPTIENITKLKYLDNVLKEVLRMYPIIYEITRKAIRTVTINNVTFPKGSNAQVPIFQIHRDPELYPDPDTFDPERWSKPRNGHSMSYLPFGSGPKTCIGSRLAQIELKMAAVQIVRKVKFCRAPCTPDKLKLKASYFLYPTRPIRVKLEPR